MGMTEQFIMQLVATALGGVIATAASIGTMIIGKRVDRKDRHRSGLIDAITDWGASFESLISITSNYCELVIRYDADSMQPDLKKMYDAEIVRVATETGCAGRRLDAARLRIVLLEHEVSVRDKVSELTKSTIPNCEINNKSNARDYLARVPSLRNELDMLLTRLGERKHFD